MSNNLPTKINVDLKENILHLINEFKAYPKPDYNGEFTKLQRETGKSTNQLEREIQTRVYKVW